jgi:hypothetical protein
MRAAVAAGYADAPAALAALEAGDPTGGTAAPGTTP